MGLRVGRITSLPEGQRTGGNSRLMEHTHVPPLILLPPQTLLLLSLSASNNGSVGIVIDELRPIKARYRVPDVVVGAAAFEQ